MNTDPLYHYLSLCEGAISLYQEAEVRLREAQAKDAQAAVTVGFGAGKLSTLVRAALDTSRAAQSRELIEEVQRLEQEAQELRERADVLAQEAAHVRTYLHPVHRRRADKELRRSSASLN